MQPNDPGVKGTEDDRLLQREIDRVTRQRFEFERRLRALTDRRNHLVYMHEQGRIREASPRIEGANDWKDVP